MKIGDKEKQRRALREAQMTRPARTAPKGGDVKVAKGDTVKATAGTARQNVSRATFDRNAYQRELMRQRRAKAKP